MVFDPGTKVQMGQATLRCVTAFMGRVLVEMKREAGETQLDPDVKGETFGPEKGRAS